MEDKVQDVSGPAFDDALKALRGSVESILAPSIGESCRVCNDLQDVAEEIQALFVVSNFVSLVTFNKLWGKVLSVQTSQRRAEADILHAVFGQGFHNCLGLGVRKRSRWPRSAGRKGQPGVD